MVIEDVKLKERFLAVRKRTEDLCARLSIEDHVVQPIGDVSPPKWHLGHTTWFFETFLLKNYHNGYKEYHPQSSYLFNSYYETVGARVIRTDRGNITRPGVEEVLQYRKYVDEKMGQLLLNDVSSEIEDLLELGLQHEQQHQELLYYDIKYILGTNPIFPAYNKEKNTVTSNRAKPVEWLKVDEGMYTIGHQGEGFSFDNEHGLHQVFLYDYEVMARLVTNEEYLAFIEDGGYEKFKYWLSDAWAWVNEERISGPLHWHKVDGQWMHYSLNGGLKPLNPGAPVVHVSYYEADAFAKWKGMRLPNEFEWEIAAKMHGSINENSNFMEADNFEPLPAVSDNNQMFGDVWEWTGSAYSAYPFYEAPEGAVGEYNGKFMVNQMVLRGGSCATPKSHIRSTYRNFFHPHLRWMFSGIRLAKYC